MKWIKVENQLPPEGKWVLAHLKVDNWHDEGDPEGVKFKVLKLETCQISGNNERPYFWVNFGPGDFWGQEVDYWMHIPELNESLEQKNNEE